jgi:hypothetical protein
MPSAECRAGSRSRTGFVLSLAAPQAAKASALDRGTDYFHANATTLKREAYSTLMSPKETLGYWGQARFGNQQTEKTRLPR